MNRRQLLFGATSVVLKPAGARKPPVLLNSIRSVRNPWLEWWDKGGRAFCRHIGLEGSYALRENEGDDVQSVAQVADAIAASGGNIVVNFDAGNAEETGRLAELCAKSKVYFVTHFNKPADLHPWRYNPYYVCHVTNNDIEFGRQTARILVDSLNGSGNIVVLGGNIKDQPSRDRVQGMKEVLGNFPAIRLLDEQNADWEASIAFEVTRWLLARFGSQINGIWAANDSMALGAIEALRTHGMAGKVRVTGMDAENDALAAIKAGELTASLIVDSFWCGGMGLALAYQAKQGLLQPRAMSADKREVDSVYRIVTRDTYDRFMRYRDSQKPMSMWDNPLDARARDYPDS